MTSKADSIADYLLELPEDRRSVILAVHETLLAHLPSGFESGMSYGMIGYHVPFSIYPSGYHCDPKKPLPFMGLAAQKNNFALYHMGIYCDEKLMKWFTDAYQSQVKTKLDMGKSCIRFKNLDAFPLALIASLSEKMSVADWVTIYESKLKK